MLRDKATLLLVLALAPTAAFGQAAQDPAVLKTATDAITAAKAPCGTISKATRNADGTISADCANGMTYMVMQVGGRSALLRFNAALNKWTPYP